MAERLPSFGQPLPQAHPGRTGARWAIVSVIGFIELIREGQLITKATFQPMVVYLVVAALYVILCWPLPVVEEKHQAPGRKIHALTDRTEQDCSLLFHFLRSMNHDPLRPCRNAAPTLRCRVVGWREPEPEAPSAAPRQDAPSRPAPAP
jgi:hypothetical protein